LLFIFILTFKVFSLVKIHFYWFAKSCRITSFKNLVQNDKRMVCEYDHTFVKFSIEKERYKVLTFQSYCLCQSINSKIFWVFCNKVKKIHTEIFYIYIDFAILYWLRYAVLVTHIQLVQVSVLYCRRETCLK
jgi:hypothetical protein